MSIENKRTKGSKPNAYRWFLLVLAPFILAACLPDGVQVPESPLLRQLERKAGLIAYIGTDFNIYTIDQAGENKVALTEDASPPIGEDPGKIYQFPVWSPQSDQLAFVGIGGPSGVLDSVGLYTASPDGTGLNSVDLDVREIPYYLFWSPDGHQISFLSTSASGASQVLKLMQTEAGDVQIVDTGSPYYWDWSPDGLKLAIHAGGQQGGRLSFLTLAPNVVEEGLSFRPSLFQAPAWSPDGSRLLLAVEDGENAGRLILTDPAGNLVETVTRFEGSIAFAWSPDGAKIAYIHSENPLQVGLAGKLSIVHLDRLGDPMTVEQELVLAFFWSPDSNKLAYFEPVRARMSEEEGGEENVQILQRIHVRELETDETQVVATYLPTQEFIRNLPYFDQYHRSATIWSPDSESLVISGFATNGAPTIWVVPASGNLPPRFITDGYLAYWSWD